MAFVDTQRPAADHRQTVKHMNSHEIDKLVGTLEGAYPSAKIRRDTVLTTWNACRQLVNFPNANRSDLINRLLKAHKFFPNLPEVLEAARAIRTPEKGMHCAQCEGMGYTYQQDFEGDAILVDHLEHAYKGTPIAYSYMEKCEMC